MEGTGALVAGGASGLGAATARALHEHGAHVVVCDLDAQRGAALAAHLGERARFVAADVTDAEHLDTAIATAADTPGGLRIAVCCAGIGHAERLARSRGAHGPDSFARVIAVNLVGTFDVLRLASTADGSALIGEDPRPPSPGVRSQRSANAAATSNVAIL